MTDCPTLTICLEAGRLEYQPAAWMGWATIHGHRRRVARVILDAGTEMLVYHSAEVGVWYEVRPAHPSNAPGWCRVCSVRLPSSDNRGTQ